MKFRFILAASVLIIPFGLVSSAYAQFLFEIGVHTGGDEITLVDDSNAVIESTKAGSLYSLELGGTIAVTDNTEAQISFGIKSDANYSKDNEASWVRYPLNGMYFYHTEKFRLGLGATVHFTPKYKVSGTTKNASSTYKNAIGGLLEVDYRLSEQVHMGLRYTNIQYVREDDDRRFDGNSIGLMLLLLI